MNKSKQAMKQALELAREGVEIHNENSPEYKVCAALLAIAEAEKQEPVAWMQESQPELYVKEEKDEKRGYVIPLYTTPQQRTWVGLTRDEIQDLLDIVDHYNYPQDLIVYTQAKLKEKNT
jgi:hypothetical protein